MLDEGRIRWIIKAKVEGWRSCDIARVQSVSVRRIQQLYSTYRRCGMIRRKVGRPNAPNISEYERFKACVCYLEHTFPTYGIRINHTRIHRVLKEEGLATSEPRKQRRRRRIRYERKHSNSLRHTDRYQIKDHRWKDLRLITGFEVYPTLTSECAVEVLNKPASTLSDHGTTFYAIESVAREKGLTAFERYLTHNKIRPITRRADHPQTNGKIEKLFDTFEKKIKYLTSTLVSD